jgi:hypothetical protein
LNHVDEHADTQPLLRAYLKDLEAALSSLPRDRRKHLISQIREHVDQALDEEPPRSPAEMRELLDRVGRPEEIAAAALEEESARPMRARTWQKALILGVTVIGLASLLGAALVVTLSYPGASRPPAAALPGSHHATAVPTRPATTPPPEARPSATRPIVPAATEPSVPPATGTLALRAILPPATVPPVSDECTEQVTYDADGNASPLTCPGGGVNTVAWQWYASAHTSTLQTSELLKLGLYATPSQVYQAICYDYTNVFKTKPMTESAGEIAQSYYGWRFGVNPLQEFEQLGCPPPS